MLQNDFLPAGRIGNSLLVILALLSSCKDRENQAPQAAATPKLKKVSYAQHQFQEFTYGAGQLSRYRSQLDLIDDEGQYLNFTVDFHYDHQKRLNQLTFPAGGGPVKYIYEGNILKKTEEYDYKGLLLITHHYTWSSNSRLLEVRDVINHVDEQSQRQLKRTYEYDAKGNLIALREYHLDVGSEAFVQNSVTAYEGYDDKKNAELPLEVYPLVQNLRLQVNNPAKKTRTETITTNRVTWTEEYTYEYNAEGYPLKKGIKITVPGADPVPPRTATYEYQP